VGPYDACDLYLLCTKPPRTLEGTADVTDDVFEPPWWSSEKFYATVTWWNPVPSFSHSVPFRVSRVCNTRMFSVTDHPFPARRYSIEGGEETCRSEIAPRVGSLTSLMRHLARTQGSRDGIHLDYERNLRRKKKKKKRKRERTRRNLASFRLTRHKEGFFLAMTRL